MNGEKDEKIALPIWIETSIADFYRQEAGAYRSRNSVICEILHKEKNRIEAERNKIKPKRE